MVVISKELFDSLYRDVPCNILVHPWASNCIKSNLIMTGSSALGSAKFYAIVYLVQIIMRGKKMTKKEQWIKMGKYYLRSTLLGITVTSSGEFLCCIFRKCLGKFTYHTYIMIPFMIAGGFIYLEPPSRRGLVINLFCNLLIEYYLRVMERAGYISLTNSKKIFAFMIGSSLLFYLMRLEGEKKQRTSIFWLFTPENVKKKSEKSSNVCPHEGHCTKYILKGYSSYFGIGLAISLSRLILPQIKTPIKAIYSVRGKHFKMALFLSSYIGIYRAVICYLCRMRGFDSALYALPAGYISGLSLLFNPNLGLAIASFTAAFKIYSATLYEKKILPSSIPLPELLFCISQGILYSARLLDPDLCPSYILNLLSTASGGKIDMTAKYFKDILRSTQ